MNNKKGSIAVVLVIVVLVLLIIGTVWYYKSHKPLVVQTPAISQSVVTSTKPTNTSTSQQLATLSPFSFSCPQSLTTPLTVYENQQMGVAFCYPSDLTVTTNTITWPTVGTSTPQLSFWILKEGNSSNVFGYLATCDASGAQGDIYCVYPKPNQITEGKNSNGFNYVLFRHNVLSGADGNPNGSIYIGNAGPSAFIPLIGQNYLAFAIVDSLHQAAGFGALPSYVDKDLLEILNTVAIMPQQYTGVGLTLTTNNLGKISVYNVIANSPALAAGIKDGNIITGINGSSTASMSFDQATGMLNATTETIMLDVQEGSDPTSTVVRLIPATFVVSGSDLGAMYQSPF